MRRYGPQLGNDGTLTRAASTGTCLPWPWASMPVRPSATWWRPCDPFPKVSHGSLGWPTTSRRAIDQRGVQCRMADSHGQDATGRSTSPAALSPCFDPASAAHQTQAVAAGGGHQRAGARRCPPSRGRGAPGVPGSAIPLSCLNEARFGIVWGAAQATSAFRWQRNGHFQYWRHFSAGPGQLARPVPRQHSQAGRVVLQHPALSRCASAKVRGDRVLASSHPAEGQRCGLAG